MGGGGVDLSFHRDVPGGDAGVRGAHSGWISLEQDAGRPGSGGQGAGVRHWLVLGCLAENCPEKPQNIKYFN